MPKFIPTVLATIQPSTFGSSWHIMTPSISQDVNKPVASKHCKWQAFSKDTKATSSAQSSCRCRASTATAAASSSTSCSSLGPTDQLPLAKAAKRKRHSKAPAWPFEKQWTTSNERIPGGAFLETWAQNLKKTACTSRQVVVVNGSTSCPSIANGQPSWDIPACWRWKCRDTSWTQLTMS